MKRILSGVAATATLAAALAVGVSTTAHADDYSYMKPTQLQQAVLRAQMPKTLGAWTQNYYYAETSTSFTVPTMCWDSKGAVTLPAAKVVGGVGYAINAGTNGSVSIYQYADAAKAQAALTALQSARCSDSPRVPGEGGGLIPAESGSDFTDDSRTSYIAGASYTEDGRQVFRSIQTTQRGLAIVQTSVYRSVEGSMTLGQRQQAVNRVNSVTQAWHTNAVRAYENFGQGRAR